MKIGIVTFVKCDNYGAELQAYALQKYLSNNGFDSEVIDLEKREKELTKSFSTIFHAIIDRVKAYGIKSPVKIIELFQKGYRRNKSTFNYLKEKEEKHKLFIDFFESEITHSVQYYSLDDIRNASLTYDKYIAGSDQIWNYMHNDNLDVYFLMFANKFNAKKISYAASISVNSIPKHLVSQYKKYLENIDDISVRELQGKDIVEQISQKKADVVLDPTLLLNKDEWKFNIANEIRKGDKYLLIYTMSGSTYIKTLAKRIAKQIDPNCKILNIKLNFLPEKNDEIENLYMVGPKEWVGLFLNAAYVVTDSFHGTAFSINFNIPFTTLLNPVSRMNSRVLSLLTIMNLKDRIIYDDGKESVPKQLEVDYSMTNKIISEWRKKSHDFLINSLK